MNKFLTILSVSAMLAIPGVNVDAQTGGSALAEAKTRLACGTGRIIGAETLANGSIRVTCQQSSALPGALAGAALTPPAAGAIGVVVLCVALCGGSDNESTTTSTAGPSSSGSGGSF